MLTNGKLYAYTVSTVLFHAESGPSELVVARPQPLPVRPTNSNLDSNSPLALGVVGLFLMNQGQAAQPATQILPTALWHPSPV
jgi:hypothetical protein